MRHINHTSDNIFDTAILIKEGGLRQSEIEHHYLHPLQSYGMDTSHVVSFSLEYLKKKQSVKDQKAYLDKLLPEIDKLGIKDVMVCDGDYFKTLTKNTKAAPHYGYVLPCKYPGFEHLNIVLCPNHQVLFVNPDAKPKIDLALSALAQHKLGNYVGLGHGIIHSEHYPESFNDIRNTLAGLHKYPTLTMDIEAFSLKHYDAGIATIGFAWSKHEGVAFPVDYEPVESNDPKQAYFGEKGYNPEVRKLLYEFFIEYDGYMVWHNASFDITVLVYQLYMDGLIDYEGMLKGLDIMTKKIHCTKIISYLATNNCAGNHLSLKDQAHEFAGNYAVSDINDVRKIPKDKLLTYNLVDCLSTFYVYEKNYPIMVADDQLGIYNDLMIPSIKDIIGMQLTGMCLDMDKVLDVERELRGIHERHMDGMMGMPFIQDFIQTLRQEKVDADNLVLKSKVRTLDEVSHITFNPNSGPQLQRILYEIMGLPVIDTTQNKQPATGGDTLKKLLNHTDVTEYKEFIEHLRGFGKVDKILSAFLPAFKAAPRANNGYHYLFGNFNLGGTVSGRLSSSGPNLQTIPSGSTYAKLIKKCFVAPKGWLMVGLDFNSLEDYISALTTNDPMKLKVYEDGFCGHCLRAANYFREDLPHIDLEDPKSVNSIKKTHPDLRQDSKPGTFALTYQGTWLTLHKNLGWSEEKSKRIEKAFHDMYGVSTQWVQERLAEASVDGYVTGAFGLRVRTPLLQKSLLGTSVTPTAAAAEGRTAGNALGQSWCLLNNRAGVEFMEKVRNSKYRYDIRCIAHIHDAQYFIVRDDMELLEWMNEHLVKAVQWQEAPEIQHDVVKIGGELSIFYPNWANEIVIDNGATSGDIVDICRKELT